VYQVSFIYKINVLMIILLQKPFMYTMCVSTITSAFPVHLVMLLFQKLEGKRTYVKQYMA